MQGML